MKTKLMILGCSFLVGCAGTQNPDGTVTPSIWTEIFGGAAQAVAENAPTNPADTTGWK